MKKKIVVIGSGLAGSLLCNALAEKAEVTLLEAGEKDIIKYPEVNYLKKKLAEFNTFCHAEGGGSNLWHNGLIPINKDDVESADFSDLLEGSKPYIDRAAQELLFEGGDYLEEYQKSLEYSQMIAKEIGAFEDGVDCLLYPKHTEKLKINESVKAYFSVKEIEFHASEKRISSISFHSKGTLEQLSPDLIVVCAGTFGSPDIVKQVLNAVGQEHGRVGQGLIDHPAGFVGKVRFGRKMTNLVKNFALKDQGNYNSCTGVRLKSECGKYTCFAFFRPAATISNLLPIYQYKSLLGGSRGAKRIKNAFSLKLFHPDILLEIFAHIFGFNFPTRTFNVMVYFQQKQGSNNVVGGNDVLDIDWSISDEELKIYNKLLCKLRSQLYGLAQRVNIQSPITEEWLRSGAHHSGTVPLTDVGNEGVDQNLKLHSVENVFVCDGSVIQEHSYANTGLTIGQLALRLADHICGVRA